MMHNILDLIKAVNLEVLILLNVSYIGKMVITFRVISKLLGQLQKQSSVQIDYIIYN